MVGFKVQAQASLPPTEAPSLPHRLGKGIEETRSFCRRDEHVRVCLRPDTMRLRILGLLVGLLSLVSALSATGSKLLVVLEEEAEKSKYSQFWADLQSE